MDYSEKKFAYSRINWVIQKKFGYSKNCVIENKLSYSEKLGYSKYLGYLENNRLLKKLGSITWKYQVRK